MPGPAESLHVVEHPGEHPDAPRVVLVHGVLDSSTSFEAVAAELADLSVMAYDRRGWGGSRHVTRADSLAEHADDLLAVIGHAPATVVAHSFGGTVALLAAARRPDVVASLGLFEPTVMWADWWPDWETQSEQAAKVQHQFRVGLEHVPKRTPEQRRADDEMLAAELALIAEPPFAFAEIAVPCLLAHSTLTTPYHVESVAQLARELGAGVVVIDDAGHTAHRARPREFAEFVRRAVTLGATRRSG